LRDLRVQNKYSYRIEVDGGVGPENISELVRAGADILVAQGTEAGGHGASRGLVTLVPEVMDAVGAEIPVVASGGIADGRGLAAAIMLGASGVLVNATGAPNLSIGGIGTNTFNWGVGVGSPPSSLSFAGKSVEGAFPEQPFVIGTLSYFNGAVRAGTEAYSVGLQTTLTFAGLTQSFDYGLKLIEVTPAFLANT
jgi:hypothetical protein